MNICDHSEVNLNACTMQFGRLFALNRWSAVENYQVHDVCKWLRLCEWMPFTSYSSTQKWKDDCTHTHTYWGYVLVVVVWAVTLFFDHIWTLACDCLQHSLQFQQPHSQFNNMFAIESSALRISTLCGFSNSWNAHAKQFSYIRQLNKHMRKRIVSVTWTHTYKYNTRVHTRPYETHYKHTHTHTGNYFVAWRLTRAFAPLFLADWFDY